ncbi:Fibrinogen alpha chain [Trichinella spiralis]|uniref:Fibrinogen alpha chain n=1 Tax=Trichinella spiralis TaxID=6334 RepID=A0ABR3L2L2_TRISP
MLCNCPKAIPSSIHNVNFLGVQHIFDVLCLEGELGGGMLWSESMESSIGNLLKYPRPSDVAIRIDKTPDLNGRR